MFSLSSPLTLKQKQMKKQCSVYVLMKSKSAGIKLKQLLLSNSVAIFKEHYSAALLTAPHMERVMVNLTRRDKNMTD